MTLFPVRSARRQNLNANRLSFADTLAWLRYSFTDALVIDTPPQLLVNPLRPGRLEPRKLKRQKKEFPYMKQSRAALKAELRAKYMLTT